MYMDINSNFLFFVQFRSSRYLTNTLSPMRLVPLVGGGGEGAGETNRRARGLGTTVVWSTEVRYEILPEELGDTLGSNSFILFRDYGTLGSNSFILFRDFTRGTQ
jgi:hypothetical protein